MGISQDHRFPTHSRETALRLLVRVKNANLALEPVINYPDHRRMHGSYVTAFRPQNSALQWHMSTYS